MTNLTKEKCSICDSPDHTHLHCYGTPAQRPSKDVAKELNDVAADAQLVGYQSPAQNALLRGAAEIKFLRAELWTLAELIFHNASSDDAKHWARRITVSINGDAPPSFAIAPDETTAITPEFAAGFERGIVEKVIKDVEALAGERTDTYWAAHAQACEEIRHRLEEAWSALPDVEPSEQRRTYTALDYVGIGPLPNCDACGRPYAEHDQIGYYCPPEKASACLHKSGCSEPLYKAGLCEAHYRECVK